MKSPTKKVFSALLKSINEVLDVVSNPGGLSNEAAHQARKALKKARAALRLLRSSIGETTYDKENTVLANASRIISPLRDAKAQIEVLTSLHEHSGKSWPGAELGTLEARLKSRLNRLRRKFQGRPVDLDQAAKALLASRRRVTRLADTPIDQTEVKLSLRKIYRQGKKTFATAKQLGTTESLHEWRKKTKYLSLGLDILGRAAGAKSARSSISKRAEQLADWLGEDHDLAVLSKEVSTSGDAVKPATTRLRTLIDNRRKTLKRRVLRLGKDTYAKRPNRVIN